MNNIRKTYENDQSHYWILTNDAEGPEVPPLGDTELAEGFKLTVGPFKDETLGALLGEEVVVVSFSTTTVTTGLVVLSSLDCSSSRAIVIAD